MQYESQLPRVMRSLLLCPVTSKEEGSVSYLLAKASSAPSLYLPLADLVFPLEANAALFASSVFTHSGLLSATAFFSL